MSELNVEIWDQTSTKKIDVTVPGDVVIERILVVLIDQLTLPKMAPTGEFMSYKLFHRQTNTQLLDEKSLDDQNVKSGDVLRLVPEITAG